MCMCTYIHKDTYVRLHAHTFNPATEILTGCFFFFLFGGGGGVGGELRILLGGSWVVMVGY